jgi:hypothetical protein
MASDRRLVSWDSAAIGATEKGGVSGRLALTDLDRQAREYVLDLGQRNRLRIARGRDRECLCPTGWT